MDSILGVAELRALDRPSEILQISQTTTKKIRTISSRPRRLLPTSVWRTHLPPHLPQRASILYCESLLMMKWVASILAGTDHGEGLIDVGPRICHRIDSIHGRETLRVRSTDYLEQNSRNPCQT